MNVPNGIWAIVFGTAIWVIQTYFPGAEWAGPVVAMVLAVAKLLQVNMTPPTVPVDPDAPQATPRGEDGTLAQPAGKVRRFFLE